MFDKVITGVFVGSFAVLTAATAYSMIAGQKNNKEYNNLYKRELDLKEKMLAQGVDMAAIAGAETAQ